jgi:UDP-GlcNAc:undecaprenyl-phosphate GlcNAc-1-phosphate transferase
MNSALAVVFIGPVTLAASVAGTECARRILQKLGVVDVPSARSSHTVVAVRGLGIGIFFAFLVAWAFALVVDPSTRAVIPLTVLIASIASALTGLAEDLKGLSVPVRSLCQLAIALGAAWVLVSATGSPWWLTIYALFFLSSYINVANFMDGLNGISGFHGVVAGVTFSCCGVLANQGWLVVTGLILAAAFAGFLPANLAGRGFMGDVGSYMLGGAIAVTSFAAVVAGVPILATIGPMIIYFGDVGWTLVRRVRRGEKWSDPHKEHVYQRVQQMGYSHIAASGLTALFSAAASVLGLLSFVLPPLLWIVLLVAGLIVLGLYMNLPRILPDKSRVDS